MDETQRFSREQLFIIWVGGFLFLWICLVTVFESQKNNQIIRPFPNATPAPVVTDLPDLIFELRQAKTIGEGRARAAITLLSQRQAQANLFQAKRLYEDAQADFNGAIDFLRTGLSRRFINSDVPRIAALMVKGKQKVDRFTGWVNNLNGPVIGAGPLDTTAEILEKWFNRVGEQNARAIEQLRADLAACRLRNWEELPVN